MMKPTQRRQADDSYRGPGDQMSHFAFLAFRLAVVDLGGVHCLLGIWGASSRAHLGGHGAGAQCLCRLALVDDFACPTATSSLCRFQYRLGPYVTGTHPQCPSVKPVLGVVRAKNPLVCIATEAGGQRLSRYDPIRPLAVRQSFGTQKDSLW